jgi:transcriptional regulator with XRE-family HTH domain
MNMLPLPTEPSFPAALKAARTHAGLNRRQLSDKAGINVVMIGRYEEPGTQSFSKPSSPTWRKLNDALGLSTSAPPPPTAVLPAVPAPEVVDLKTATLDQIVAEVRSRGAAMTLSFPAGGLGLKPQNF